MAIDISQVTAGCGPAISVQPTLLNGTPVPVIITVTVSFKLQ
jgi:hypothetical protein